MPSNSFTSPGSRLCRLPQDFQTAYGFGAEAYGRPDWLTGRLPGGSHNSAFTTESLSKACSNAPQFGR